ncbi:MAG: aspartate aminotransferase family protein [Phycisphaerae bacterium]|nr:aspartate aminotransferase family protein [Phycisphaerae bacterium]
MSKPSKRPLAGVAEDVLAAKAKYGFPCVHHLYRDPPVLVGGEGCYLIDRDGRRFLDVYSGGGVMNAGYRNPMVLNAVVDQLWKLQHAAPGHLSELMFQLAQLLAELAPGDVVRSFFCASGFEANEVAMELATQATGRHEFITLTEAPIGRAKDLSHILCHRKLWHRSLAGGVTGETPVQQESEAIERALTDVGPERIAAVIAEPIQIGSGIVVPPDGTWQRVRRICDEHGVLLIFDEALTAMNRTGCWFASEAWQVTPDILTVAGSLGNGVPIAAVMTTDRIAAGLAQWEAPAFGASPVSCAAALATIRFHRTASLGQRAARYGEALLAGLAKVAEGSAYLAHPRGKGLMIGVDVVDDRREPDAERCDEYLEQLKDWGFLAGRTGRHHNVLTLMPPLTVTEDQVDLIVSVFGEL